MFGKINTQSWGWKKEITKQCGGQACSRGGFTKTPPVGDYQDCEEQDQNSSGGMDMPNRNAQRNNPGNDDKGSGHSEYPARNAHPHVRLLGCAEITRGRLSGAMSIAPMITAGLLSNNPSSAISQPKTSTEKYGTSN